jgi:hypothetical protein
MSLFYMSLLLEGMGLRYMDIQAGPKYLVLGFLSLLVFFVWAACDNNSRFHSFICFRFFRLVRTVSDMVFFSVFVLNAKLLLLY